MRNRLSRVSKIRAGLIRLRSRRFLVVAIVILVAILATHVDFSQILSNPWVLVIGGVAIGLHLLGGAIAAIVAFSARRRWSGWQRSAAQAARKED